MKMKWLVLFRWVTLLMVLIASSCNFGEDGSDRSFNQNLQSFNDSFNKVDSAILLIDQMQDELVIVEEQQQNGQLDAGEAKRARQRIRSDYGNRISQNSQVMPVTGLPLWASQLGLSEPVGMTLDANFSQSTSESNLNEGYNSIVLVYRGSYDRAMQQAQIISSRASIPMSKDFADAQQLAREYDIAVLKGMAYMNFEIGATQLPPYSIAITVDEDGTLTISATDTQKFNEQLNDLE